MEEQPNTPFPPVTSPQPQVSAPVAAPPKPEVISPPKTEPPKNPVGRPPSWTDYLAVKQMIMDYFNSDIGKDRPTLSGLALAIGVDRKTLYNYSLKDEFFPILKEAKDRIMSVYEDRLIYSEKPTGVIFALKNMGWSDNLQVDHTTKGEKVSGFNYIIPTQSQDDPDNQTVTETAPSIPTT